jgi:hypothetical protein
VEGGLKRFNHIGVCLCILQAKIPELTLKL